jgi:hypothetical protein
MEAKHINLQVKLEGVYAETYHRFISNNPECKTHRDAVTAILRTLPEYKAVMAEKEGAKV